MTTTVNRKTQVTQPTHETGPITGVLQDVTYIDKVSGCAQHYMRVDVVVGGKRLALKVWQNGSYTINAGNAEDPVEGKFALASDLAAGSLKSGSWFSVPDRSEPG